MVWAKTSFQFWDTSLCFVNCHLAAHVGQTKARNEDYRGISAIYKSVL
jgi:hypothetical protein